MGVKVDVMSLRGMDGMLTGRGHVRAMFPGRGPETVTANRPLAGAERDLQTVLDHGIHAYRVSFPSRGFTLFAPTEDAACDLAVQRWGDKLGYPYAVEPMGRDWEAEAWA